MCLPVRIKAHEAIAPCHIGSCVLRDFPLFWSERFMAHIHTVVTHHRPHLDEICALMLLRRFGEERFPGIGTARLDYWTNDGEQNGRAAEEYEKDGILLLGVGGGRFDEHAAGDAPRKTKECCATLVAKELGIEDDPALESILRFVRTTDLNEASPFDLASIVKMLHARYPRQPEHAIEFATWILEAKLEEQQRFWNETARAFTNCSELRTILGTCTTDSGVRTLNLLVAVIGTDDELMNRYARAKQGTNAAIVVQVTSRGNVQIFTNRRWNILSLYDIVKILRIKEQEKAGAPLTTNWRELQGEAQVPGAEAWYFHERGEMILNGALSAPDVPPTKLSIEEILEAVRIGVNLQIFAPTRARECTMGTCSSTEKNPCPWLKYRLNRCRNVQRLTA